MQAIITLKELSTGYRSSRSEHLVSRRISLEANRGEVIMLMGPNGSGKSTLMQTIAGLIKPLQGEVHITSQPIAGIRDKERAKLMSLVLTERIEHTGLTVWDIASTGRYPYLGQRGKLHSTDIAILERSLDTCRLADMAHRRYSELSDGEKQRVMIARALAQETPLMLLDEPTAHLDLPSRLDILTMLRQLARDLNKCILVSTHELDLALQWADGIWLFDKQGSIVAGAPEELILSGDIERVFGNERMHFDAETGEFHLVSPYQPCVHLVAEGLRYTWAVRALQRMGYRGSHEMREGIPSVEALPEGWRLLIQGQELHAQDLSELQRLLYSHYPIGTAPGRPAED